MEAPAVVIVPTAGRPGPLDAALSSIAPQARAASADLLVVDDSGSPLTAEIAVRHGARHVRTTGGPGLNAARNTGVDSSTAPLLCFVDDDVEVRDGWLDALIAADRDEPDDVLVLTGPILARFDGVMRRTCGRELPPITHLDLGADDTDTRYAWGANMAIRRSAIERAGRFDVAIGGAGDEQEWQDRVHAAGGRVRYIAAAGLDHVRSGTDATPRALRRAAYARGRAARRFDRGQGRTPALAQELRVLAGSAAHGPRFRCANGPVMAAHAAGRVREALAERFGASVPPARAGIDDFLSGRSGIATGRTAIALRAYDRLLDLRALPARGRRGRAAAALKPLRVLAVSIEQPDGAPLLDAAIAELRASRHDVTIVRAPVTPGIGKFARLDDLLATSTIDHDWLLVVDDDVTLPRGFLDTFLAACVTGDLALAQPAHRRHSHAAWPVTLRQSGCDWRETTFCEIGPVTAFRADAAALLLPFPEDAAMGWGLDVHWSTICAGHGLRLGVVDATPIEHSSRLTAGAYDGAAAAQAARAFLEQRPYTPRDEVRTLSCHRFGEAR